ncbi:hypothetical protein D1007_44036 [Hordeum vulgare]|nr:hypothetical protein D1007_44036 [Hordeum vulgare]
MASRQPAHARAPSCLNLTRGALRSVDEASAGEEAGPPTGGAHLSGSSPTSNHRGGGGRRRAQAPMSTGMGSPDHRLPAGGRNNDGGGGGGQGFASDEVAVAEGFREAVGEVARDTGKLGRVGGKLPGVKGVRLRG